MQIRNNFRCCVKTMLMQPMESSLAILSRRRAEKSAWTNRTWTGIEAGSEAAIGRREKVGIKGRREDLLRGGRGRSRDVCTSWVSLVYIVCAGRSAYTSFRPASPAGPANEASERVYMSGAPT